MKITALNRRSENARPTGVMINCSVIVEPITVELDELPAWLSENDALLAPSVPRAALYLAGRFSRNGLAEFVQVSRDGLIQQIALDWPTAIVFAASIV